MSNYQNFNLPQAVYPATIVVLSKTITFAGAGNLVGLTIKEIFDITADKYIYSNDANSPLQGTQAVNAANAIVVTLSDDADLSGVSNSDTIKVLISVYSDSLIVDMLASGAVEGVATIIGTANRITVTGTVHAVVDISSSYTGQGSITTVGTLTGGATGAGFTVALSTSTITGTLADARLSANVPLINAMNNFTTTQTISESSTGTGTISVTASGTTVTGTGTHFLYDFNIGDTITANSETRTITAIASDTSMTTTAWTSTFSGAYTLVGGTRYVFSGRGELLLGTATPSTASSNIIKGAKLFTNGGTTANNGGLRFDINFSHTDSSASGSSIGFTMIASIDATNTQNLTNATSAVLGGSFQALIASGAAGTITGMTGLSVTWNNNSATATVTTAYGIRINTPTATGTITNAVGLSLNAITAATNNTYLLIGTATPQAGNYGIYVASANDNYFAGNIIAANIIGTNYTPTATNVTNITSSTPNNANYTRTGNVVTVFGSVIITNTLAVASQLDVSLPIASNFAAATDLNGMGTNDAVFAANIVIKGDAANDRASIYFTSVGVGGTATIYYSFQYKVI